mgnify:CR=1 FL=1
MECVDERSLGASSPVTGQSDSEAPSGTMGPPAGTLVEARRMPVVHRFGPYVFRIHSNENRESREPRHVHVRSGNGAAVSWLDPRRAPGVVGIQSGGVGPGPGGGPHRRGDAGGYRTGTLNVGGSLGFGRRYLAPAIADFTARYPSISIELMLSDRIVDLVDEGFDVVAIDRADDAAAYVHDRRDGERSPVVETDDPPLSRHELDELYAATLREAMGAAVVLLSGPAGDEVLPADTYRRLAADLGAFDCLVMVDLAGERLDHALQGGVDIVKVSHEELLDDGRLGVDAGHADAGRADESAIVEAMHRLRSDGAGAVIVSRESEGVLALIDGTVVRATAPDMEVVDTKGAGDSLTAAIAATTAREGADLRRAVAVGAAAGALNVTRHGLGTGDEGAILALAQHVVVTDREG